VAGAAPLGAQSSHLGILRAKLDTALVAEAEAFTGVAGWAIVDLASGDTFEHNGALVFPQGSAIKIPVLLELFRRDEVEPGFVETRVPLRRADMVGGSGVLLHLTDGGTEMSLEDLAIYMIRYSDNTATNLLIETLGMEAINALSVSLGARQTLVQRKMIQSEASARGEENLSTPREAVRIMMAIASCELPMSEARCARVREILEIPKDGALVDPIPAGVPVAWKPGGITGVSTAWGIVGLEDHPYAIAIMSTYGSGPTVEGRYGSGAELIRRVSTLALDYFGKLDGATRYGTRVPVPLLRRVRGGN
jgi:beta-lactamase class A